MAYGQSPEVQVALQQSNRRFDQMRDAQSYIDKNDIAWRKVPDGSFNPLMRRVLGNSISKSMSARLKTYNETYKYSIFGEVFITNRHGTNIAQTNRTSDYRQDDEVWWQQAKRDGMYVTEINFDTSAGIYSTSICLRVDDEHGDFIGVIKIVLNIKEVVDIIDTQLADEKHHSEYNYLLFDSKRQIIHSADPTDKFLSDGSSYFEGIETPAEGTVFTTYKAHNPDNNETHWRLMTYAFSSGFAEYTGLGWTLVIDHNAK
jgi:hypothetical protein